MSHCRLSFSTGLPVIKLRLVPFFMLLYGASLIPCPITYFILRQPISLDNFLCSLCLIPKFLTDTLSLFSDSQSSQSLNGYLAFLPDNNLEQGFSTYGPWPSSGPWSINQNESNMYNIYV